MQPEYLLAVLRLSVQNANAISSPLTWGFPSPTAFLGVADALTRWSQAALDITVTGVAVVCHRFEPQVSKPPGKYHYVFCLTRNPGGSDGKPEALVEEGRAHLEVSLVFGVAGAGLYNGERTHDEIRAEFAERLSEMRIAGGSIVPNARGQLHKTSLLAVDADAKLQRRFVRGLLPGFALVSREAVLAAHTQSIRASDTSKTSLDALLDFCRINHECAPDPDDATKGIWSIRKRPGWFVPIPAGYRAISQLYEPGVVKNTRDRTTPFRFVETILTLGQWVSPHRVEHPKHLLWSTQVDTAAGLYVCTTSHFSKQELPATKEG